MQEKDNNKDKNNDKYKKDKDSDNVNQIVYFRYLWQARQEKQVVW